jgi:hypothetical protein
MSLAENPNTTKPKLSLGSLRKAAEPVAFVVDDNPRKHPEAGRVEGRGLNFAPISDINRPLLPQR